MKEITVVSAVWCPSCLILKKYLKKINKNYPDLKVNTLDYDFDEEEIQKLNVRKILPVIIKYKDDKEERLIGEKTYEEIEAFLNEK